VSRWRFHRRAKEILKSSVAGRQVTSPTGLPFAPSRGSGRDVPPYCLLALVLGLVFVLSIAQRALAQAGSVPPAVQADLVAKLLPYDRNFETRAGPVVRTLVLVRGGSVRSRIAAEAFKSALSNLDRLGGRRHENASSVTRTRQRSPNSAAQTTLPWSTSRPTSTPSSTR
jgi:hypothetical protein